MAVFYFTQFSFVYSLLKNSCNSLMYSRIRNISEWLQAMYRICKILEIMAMIPTLNVSHYLLVRLNSIFFKNTTLSKCQLCMRNEIFQGSFPMSEWKMELFCFGPGEHWSLKCSEGAAIPGSSLLCFLPLFSEEENGLQVSWLVQQSVASMILQFIFQLY